MKKFLLCGIEKAFTVSVDANTKNQVQTIKPVTPDFDCPMYSSFEFDWNGLNVRVREGTSVMIWGDQAVDLSGIYLIESEQPFRATCYPWDLFITQDMGCKEA